jgi:hypothetical protein
MTVDLTLHEIPANQHLDEPHRSTLNWTVTPEHIEQALKLAKNQSVSGLDGLPYELWKTLQITSTKACHKNQMGFNIVKTLTEVLNNIQTFGLAPNSNFTSGWMCPIFKKKDPTDISNYHPITLMNTDYKLLTKILGLQLTEHSHMLIHSDQAGFIPCCLIYNHI